MNLVLLLSSPQAFSSGNQDSSSNKCREAVRSLSDSAELIKTQEPVKHLTTILMFPIEVLNFSISSQDAFKSNNINYLVELAVRTEAELLGLPGFESQNLIEVKKVLSKMGLLLGMNVDWLLNQAEVAKPVKSLSSGESPVTTISIESHPILALPIHSLELSILSLNALKYENIKHLGELVQKTEAESLKMRNFGRKSLNEIKDILSGLGLQLRMTVVDWPSTTERLEELEAQAQKIYNESPLSSALFHSSEELSPAPVVSIESHPILALPIPMLDVANHVRKALYPFRLGDVIQDSEEELLRTPGFGNKGLAEVKDILSIIGLQLGMTVINWPPNPEKLEELEKQAQKIYEEQVKNIYYETLGFYPRLTEKEEKVLRMWFGIGEEKQHSYRAIGQVFNVSRERIRQIKMKALRKLYPIAKYSLGMDAITSPLDSKYVVEELLKRLEEKKKQAPALHGSAVENELG